MEIYIDADSCPTRVSNYVNDLCKAKNLPLTLVSNATKNIAGAVIVANHKDAADNYIFKKAVAGDIVITRDTVFAARLIEKGICAINDRGLVFTNDNIKDILKSRDFNMQLSALGLINKRHHYNNNNFESFVKCFTKLIKNKTQ